MISELEAQKSNLEGLIVTKSHDLETFKVRHVVLRSGARMPDPLWGLSFALGATDHR
jgi:hypothetical protein